MRNMEVVKRLMNFIKKYRYIIIAIIITSVIGNIALLFTPRLIGDSIDLIIPSIESNDYSSLLKLLTIIGLLYVIGSSLNWITAILANKVTNHTIRDLRYALFDKVGRLPINYFDSHPRGDIINRFTNDIEAISEGLNQTIVQLVSGIITVIFSLIFMLLMSPRITLVVILVTPISFLVGYFITKMGNSSFNEQTKILADLNSYSEEIISGQKTVRTFNYEEEVEKKFWEINQDLYETGYRAQFASAIVNPSTRFVNNIAYVLVGVFSLLSGLSPGRIASFLTYTNQYSKPFNEITSITMQIQMGIASARRVFQILDEEEEISDENADNLYVDRGKIEFQDVSFSYTSDKNLIENLNLQVEPGETIAIVGPTGAGKTTIVNLLMRFYDIDEGCISIDGQNISAVKRDGLRRSFGMVLQDTWLFSGSIRDNISYGYEDATEEEIVEAAKAAHAHSFIIRMPEGYDTIISEDGGNLSTGQRQLLTIARVMLLSPQMLILDEATSSVDILTEQRIQEAFNKMMEGRTTFVIAHRLSTIKNADSILVLDKGKVIEQGSHDYLIEKGGFYYNLYNSQFAQIEE